MKLKRQRLIRASGPISRGVAVSVYGSLEEILLAIDRSIDCCDSITNLVQGMTVEDFMSNPTVMKAVAMDFQTIGNFMGKMPEELICGRRLL